MNLPNAEYYEMKVLYLHQHFATRSGHAGTRSYEFARHMVNEGDQIVMVCGRNSKASLDLPTTGHVLQRTFDGIDVRIINAPYGNHLSYYQRLKAFFDYAVWAAVVGVREKEVDVVFATSTPLTVAIPGIIIAVLTRRPLVFEVRDIWPESATATGALRNPVLIWLAKKLERFTYWYAVRIIALSDRMKARMVANTGVDPEKVDVVHIGADLDLFGQKRDPDLRRTQGLEDQFVAIFPGAHGVANGLDVLVDAAQYLDDDVRIALVGEGGQKRRLMEKARAAGAEKILFFDPIAKEKLAGVLADMDCGLQILKPLEVFETVAPNKFFDFAASGLPIVVNFPGEVADLVSEAKAGVYIPVSTPETVAACLNDLARHPLKVNEMRANARRLAERFARPDLARRFRATLASVLPAEKRSNKQAAPAS